MWVYFIVIRTSACRCQSPRTRGGSHCLTGEFLLSLLHGNQAGMATAYGPSERSATTESGAASGQRMPFPDYEIRCQFTILARKDEPTSRQEARERCVGLSAISSLLQKGDSRVMSLGHPSYPRPKGTRNHSMAEKRGYVEIGETGPRKTRVAWSKLDRLNPNPDRGLSYSVVRPIEHDVIECRPFPFRGYGKPAR